MNKPKITSAEFKLSVHRAGHLPPPELPEVAFVGRSNVGKSSLLNSLLGRRKLVRVSAAPGCTQALNFFLINKRWYFVDLPGYGYARVSKQTQARWGGLILGYLETRPSLAAVVFLQDPRRRPGPEELFLWERLQAVGRAVVPVFTKADKVKKGERARQQQEISAALERFPAAPGPFLWFSATTGEGRDSLWERILQLIG